MLYDEQLRLEDLYATGLLDSPAESRFDRITQLACQALQVPIALVSLVDANRQWFKSCVGLAVSETSRDVSFCSHAVMSDDILVIEDAQRDERFRDNELVTG